MTRPRILVVRGDAISSRAIEGFGGGWPSHMANVLADGSVWDARDDKIRFGGEVYSPGVRHRPAGYLPAENKHWELFEAPSGSESVYDRWVSDLASQEAKGYDENGIGDFAWGLFTGEYSDKNYASDDPAKSLAWFCDEYAVWAAGRNKLVPWPIPTKIYTLTPGAALMLFIGAGWVKVGQSAA
jgi:hypothetical protein